MHKIIAIVILVFIATPILAPAEVTSVNETGFSLACEQSSS
jgi:hypothetical protein